MDHGWIPKIRGWISWVGLYQHQSLQTGIRKACRSALKGIVVSVGKGYERVTKKKHVKIRWEYVLFSTMQCNAGSILFLDTSGVFGGGRSTRRGKQPAPPPPDLLSLAHLILPLVHFRKNNKYGAH